MGLNACCGGNYWRARQTDKSLSGYGVAGAHGALQMWSSFSLLAQLPFLFLGSLRVWVCGNCPPQQQQQRQSLWLLRFIYLARANFTARLLYHSSSSHHYGQDSFGKDGTRVLPNGNLGRRLLPSSFSLFCITPAGDFSVGCKFTNCFLPRRPLGTF